VETLAFYSYKGGVGRSLLLANAARFLVTLGKGVVALDFDFEAPGLHYKLGGEVGRKLNLSKSGGVVPYLLATSTGADSTSLKEHLVDVSFGQEVKGWLRLMPAGPAPDRAYWSALRALGERLRFDDPSGSGLLAVLDLQARIEEELNPDYLLVDARTGVTEIGALATTVLADIVLCLFAANLESLDGTVTVVEALKAAPRLKGQKPVRVVPILSRTTMTPAVGAELTAGVQRLLELGEGRKPGTRDEADLFTLPHEGLLCGDEWLVSGETKASLRVPPYRAHLELFQVLFSTSAESARQAIERLPPF
jgi:hypothetical protein